MDTALMPSLGGKNKQSMSGLRPASSDILAREETNDGGSVGGEDESRDGDPSAVRAGEFSVQRARSQYLSGDFRTALATCEMVYQSNARRKDNLLLMGAIHFQVRNFSESVFYNQQAIRVDPKFAEAFGNLGNALRELGDTNAAVEFYLKAIKLKPRYCDAYNNLASAYMQLGRTKQALETYQMALVLNPGLVNAHSNMGNLYKAQGRLEDARKSYLEAIRIRPDFAIAWSNIAGLFKDEGELDTSIAYYQEAVRLAPNLADAHSNMGNALKEAGRFEEADRAYKRAIELRPDFAIAYGNLGNVYYDLGHMDKAVANYKHALLLEPNYPDAHNNLGNALSELGDIDGALKRFRKCIKLKPDHPHAYNNLGNLLKDKGMVKEAMHCYITAVRLMPRFAAAHSNLASLLKEQGRVDQAIAHYQECVSIDPRFAPAFSNLGNAYKDAGRLMDSIKCFTTAIRLDPALAVAYLNLGMAYRDAGRLDDAISCFRKALKLKPSFPDAEVSLAHTLAMVCDWQSRTNDCKTMSKLLHDQLAQVDDWGAAHPSSVPPVLSIQPFHTCAFSISELTSEEAEDLNEAKTMDLLLRLNQSYAMRAKRIVQLQELPKLSNKARLPDERLKVGYVSAHFGDTPLAFLMQSVFTMHDEGDFEVFCYATSESDGSRLRRRVEREAEHFRKIALLSNFDAAKIINTDGVHVLVNLDGYTSGARTEIFAMQPAPVQMATMHNFCANMCANFIQYTVVDKELAKADDATRPGGADKLVIMPNSFQVTDHKQSARFMLDPKQCPSRKDVGLEEDKVVLAAFAQGYKIDPSTFACWISILEKAPKAVLWMLNSPKIAQDNIKAEARAKGIREERIVFSDLDARSVHLKRIYLADLFLDTPNCNSQATATDVLWAGVPILTCVPEKGGRMASRAVASMLKDCGLDSLIARSMKQYEDIAVNMVARDSNKLWDLRKDLEVSRISCPLFDTSQWVTDFENGLRSVWELHEKGEKPDDILI